MTEISIRTFKQADIRAVESLQRAYAAVFPGGPLRPGEMYRSPSFHGGDDVFCAFDGQKLLAYAPLYLVEGGKKTQPLVAWIEILADPDLPDPDPIKDALLERLIARARGLANGREVRLTFEYRADETPAIEYALAHGFEYLESAYVMVRGLDDGPLPVLPLPARIILRRWKMTRKAEQSAYVQARNACFPFQPIDLVHWQHYMHSPQWDAGTMIAAFDGSELAGAVNVYWNEEENKTAKRPFGYTEDIFVLPPWRGKGVARAAIVEGLRYLKEHGLKEARLTVAARNENALDLYRQLGYTLVNESRSYARLIT